MIDRIGEQNRIEQMRREEKRTEKLKENFPLCVFFYPIITPTYYSEITAAPFSFIDHELLSLSLLSLSLSLSPSLYSYHRISAHSGTVKTTHVDIKNVADLADPDHVLEQRDSDRCV